MSYDSWKATEPDVQPCPDCNKNPCGCAVAAAAETFRRERDAAIDRHKRDAAILESEIGRLSSEVSMLAHVLVSGDVAPMLEKLGMVTADRNSLLNDHTRLSSALAAAEKERDAALEQLAGVNSHDAYLTQRNRLREQQDENARLMTLLGEAMKTQEALTKERDEARADCDAYAEFDEHTRDLVGAADDWVDRECSGELTTCVETEYHAAGCPHADLEERLVAAVRAIQPISLAPHPRIVRLTAERDSARAEAEKMRKERDEAMRIYRAREAEIGELRGVLGPAFDVVNERRAKIGHARESANMCRLAKAVDAYVAPANTAFAQDEREGKGE